LTAITYFTSLAVLRTTAKLLEAVATYTFKTISTVHVIGAFRCKHTASANADFAFITTLRIQETLGTRHTNTVGSAAFFRRAIFVTHATKVGNTSTIVRTQLVFSAPRIIGTALTNPIHTEESIAVFGAFAHGGNTFAAKGCASWRARSNITTDLRAPIRSTFRRDTVKSLCHTYEGNTFAVWNITGLAFFAVRIACTPFFNA
jgi:hypothetical protein